MGKHSKPITCQKCGQEIAPRAKTCPHCGAKVAKPIYKKVWFWILIAVVLIGISGNEMSSNMSTQRSKQEEKEEVIPNIDNAVVYEGHDVIISATEIKKTEKGWDVNLLIENNSSLNLGFNAHAYAINGIMTRNNIFSMDCDVAAGKKANTTLELKNSVIREYGIQNIRCIDALLWAYDNDKMFKSFDTNQLEIKTSLFDNTHDEVQGSTIFNEGGIKVDYLNTEGNKYNFSITNLTGSYLSFDFDEITINGFTNSELDFDLYDEFILSDCQIVVTVEVSNDFKNANKIDTVETIEWNMSVRPYGDVFQEYKIGPIVFDVE